MENREHIYDLAERLGAIIEVIKDDKLVGNFKFIDGKLHKLKTNETEKTNIERNQNPN
jgi:hypothetical protein